MRTFFFLLFSSFLSANPFLLDIAPKETLTESDWVSIQEKLQTIDLSKTLDPIYPENCKKKTLFKKEELKAKDDFLGRISRGARQTLISEDRKPPIKQLIQINKGGPSCIVTFASYNGVYAEHAKALVQKLKDTGFNGHFLLMLGGFPNPTGKEIRCAAVPYCFKIFALLEAKKLGFDKALWLDASMEPLKSPEPLFDWIEQTGSFFSTRKNGTRYLLPKTREVLLQETGIDMYEEKSVRARIIGLDFRYSHIQELIEEYYKMVELGTPFISCFPEEYVLGALIAKNPEKYKTHPFTKLTKNERKLHGRSMKDLQDQKYFFLLQRH